MELDARDRQKEKEELEELRAKIFSNSDADPNLDPNVEFAKVTKNKSLELKIISLSKDCSLGFFDISYNNLLVLVFNVNKVR